MKILLSFFIFLEIVSAWNLYPSYPNYLKRRSKYIKNFFFKANTTSKVVALSFDDGPNYKTKKLMKILEKYKVPATFFLIGKNLRKKYDKLYKNPLFDVGMHSLRHRNFDHYSYKIIKKDFAKTITLFKKHNLNTSLFRPPYGVVNQKVSRALKEFRLKGILWSNDTNDWSKRRSYKRVISHLNSGDIILLHDHSTSPKNLESLIINIQKKGFKIVPLKYLLKYKSSYPF